MQKIFSLHAKKKGRKPKAGPPVHDDLVDRDFIATEPNTKWLTDITEPFSSCCGGEFVVHQGVYGLGDASVPVGTAA